MKEQAFDFVEIYRKKLYLNHPCYPDSISISFFSSPEPKAPGELIV